MQDTIQNATNEILAGMREAAKYSDYHVNVKTDNFTIDLFDDAILCRRGSVLIGYVLHIRGRGYVTWGKPYFLEAFYRYMYWIR